jgi:predicted dehydrogenase
MNIAIIGCGLIGTKRIHNLDPDDKVVVVCDTSEVVVKKFATQLSTGFTTNWKDAVVRPDVDAVIIATTHNKLAEITLDSLKNGKHVLVEKPAGKNAEDLEPILQEYSKFKDFKHHPIIKVGFNHRFHPALQKAKEIFDSGVTGELMFIRGRYGHGGRIGYDKEWRAKPEISGGGELLDQGMHLIDLSRWFMGDIQKVIGIAKTYYWDMQVDDNAFLLLENAHGKIAQLHVTWTEWKNLFSFEIYTQYTKLHIEGLGGSYGVERLSIYQMKPEMGPPDTVIYEYPGSDVSWKAEWKNFKESVLDSKKICGDIYDAYEGLKVVKEVYSQKK